MKDTARVLGRMFDGIEYRGSSQQAVETLGAYAGVPVWNGLTDDWHPTQMLADILTMRDHISKPLAEVSYCYLGDGRNNTANSLLVTGALLGMDVRICAPGAAAALDGRARHRREARGRFGARLTVTSDMPAAVAGADYLYTDVWLSMGEPAASGRAHRPAAAVPGEPGPRSGHGEPGGQVHALPAALHNRETKIGQQVYDKRGLEALEVTEEVFESPASIVFDQAENRLHTIKAVMVATAGDVL